ncbi:MAG: methyltransferase [Iamia sp.]
MDDLDGPWGSLTLARHPERADDPLRAFDAADEMVLAHLAEADVDLTGTIVILNDTWGALATALAAHRPVVVTDSHLARRGVAANLERNSIDTEAVEMRGPLDPLPNRIDVLLVRPPKPADLLEHLLRQAHPGLHAGTTVVGAAMTRHVHRSGLDLFEGLVGPTRTSRAVRKARLIHPTVDPDLDPAPSPWPHTTGMGPQGEEVVEHAGVFSAGRLDAGTRLLLAHLPEPGDHGDIVDLGCGNGIVGLVLAGRDPAAHLTFLDESALAVASAQATFRHAFGSERDARFSVGDGLFDLATGPPIEPGAVDLVVVNPPFHRDHSVGDATAWQMFTEADLALRPGGRLLVVGNRHLAYHAKLKRIFGNSTVVASDPGFVVLSATHR